MSSLFDPRSNACSRVTDPGPQPSISFLLHHPWFFCWQNKYSTQFATYFLKTSQPYIYSLLVSLWAFSIQAITTTLYCVIIMCCYDPTKQSLQPCTKARHVFVHASSADCTAQPVTHSQSQTTPNQSCPCQPQPAAHRHSPH